MCADSFVISVVFCFDAGLQSIDWLTWPSQPLLLEMMMVVLR